MREIGQSKFIGRHQTHDSCRQHVVIDRFPELKPSVPR